MWELASVLNFLHVFRSLLNIAVEFTAEELEDAIIMPNNMLDDLHMPLLKSIPPATRMAMGDGKWITVLCRKMKNWWHQVAEGDLPIVASHGAEIEMYKALEPETRLVILKAICDLRAEQEDIRNFVDNCLKKGYQLHSFRKERIGGDSHGISYWYEEDPILGHRLYRGIRQVEYVKEQTKQSKGKSVSSVPVVSYKWETVAANFDEFEAAAEKLFSSRNRTEVSLGKKLKIDYIPEIEKIHKRKMGLLKKQQREALLLNSYMTFDGFTSGRSRRERKRVTYTFDDYDRSIDEAIKTTKKSEKPIGVATTINRGLLDRTREESSNGRLSGPSPVCNGFHGEYPLKQHGHQASAGAEKAETLHGRCRQRKRSQGSTPDFVESVLYIDPNVDSDDSIMGEAVYDEEYLRSKKQPRASTSEDDGAFRLEKVTADSVDQEEYSLSSEDERSQWYKRSPTSSPQGTGLRTMDEIQTGVRRSKRSTRPRMKHQQYGLSGTDTEQGHPGKPNASDPDVRSDAPNNAETSVRSPDQEERLLHVVKMHTPGRESKGVGRRFLHLNELVPAGGLDVAPFQS